MKKNEGLRFYVPEKKNHFPVLSEVMTCFILMLIAAFIAIVSVYFFGMKCNVIGSSMEPTAYNGQEILVNRFAYALGVPKKGDVVVFLPHGNENSHYYVKRIVAGPGDRVQIRDGKLYVNDQESDLIKEPIDDPGIAENVLTLQNGQFFCMGDNPEDGEDSRQANVGPVDKKDMIGKAWWRMARGDADMGLIR